MALFLSALLKTIKEQIKFQKELEANLPQSFDL
jgi:hypothetical protein